MGQSQELQRSLESITVLNAALRDSDIRTQAVLDNVVDAIFIPNEEGVVESVNRSVRQLFGCHANEPVGHPFASVIAPEYSDEFRAPNRTHAEPLREGDLPNRVIETVGCREDGSTFPMELGRASPTNLTLINEETPTPTTIRPVPSRQRIPQPHGAVPGRHRGVGEGSRRGRAVRPGPSVGGAHGQWAALLTLEAWSFSVLPARADVRRSGREGRRGGRVAPPVALGRSASVPAAW
jgi:PAS domain S-box-containing protein